MSYCWRPQGPFTNYIYKWRGVGGQNNRIFVNFYSIENVNGGGQVVKKTSASLQLTFQITAGICLSIQCRKILNLRHIFWQVRIVKVAIKQLKQKDDRIYRLYQFHTFLFKGLKQSLRNNFEPTNNLQVNSKGNMQVCKKNTEKMSVYFFTRKIKIFFQFLYHRGRQSLVDLVIFLKQLTTNKCVN